MQWLDAKVYRRMITSMRKILTIMIYTAVTIGYSGLAYPESFIALVIGNNNYQNIPKLQSSINDAQAISNELAIRNFKVIFRRDASRREMNDAIDEFMANLSSDAVGIVYFSGHGVQINSANYLLPIDIIEPDQPSQVTNDAINLGLLVERMAAMRTKFSLVIVDACRDNPFPNSYGKSIGGSRGLTALATDAQGLMVVYAAGVNQQALDKLGPDDTSPNSLFTREFLKAMQKPGLTVPEVVYATKFAVIAKARTVGMVQTPAIYDQTTGKF
ncbi:hypothetical protein TI04_10780, partial [Achromatium sp. WMS2]